MRYVVTASKMRQYDTNTIERIGIPGMVLMERAALAARDRVLAFCDTQKSKEKDIAYRTRGKKRILILVGMGNNGGDGLALARLLAEKGFVVEVWCVGKAEKASKQWTEQFKILKSYNVIWSDEPKFLEYTVLVDALFGVGLSREVTGEYQKAIDIFNCIQGYKIALDVPSGICSDTGKMLGCAVCADETVTFAFAKRGLYLYPGCEMAGFIHVADIGINERGFGDSLPDMFCLDDVSAWLPDRTEAGNKGTFGKVLVIAGSKGMAGAAVLCAKAAYRAGAGMVKVLTHESNREILQTCLPEAMYDIFENVEQAMEWADVIAIGPGLGQTKEAAKLLLVAIEKSRKPLVVDADGLNLLAADHSLCELLSVQTERKVILTPHVGELARLTGVPVKCLKEKLWEHGREVAERLHAVVVAKDAKTFVCCKEQPVYINIYGNSGMATAGSGDVLTGMIAGLMGQYEAGDLKNEMPTEFRAACAGVRLHAAAGDAAAKMKGEYACMAGDIAEAVSGCMAWS